MTFTTPRVLPHAAAAKLIAASSIAALLFAVPVMAVADEDAAAHDAMAVYGASVDTEGDWAAAGSQEGEGQAEALLVTDLEADPEGGDGESSASDETTDAQPGEPASLETDESFVLPSEAGQDESDTLSVDGMVQATQAADPELGELPDEAFGIMQDAADAQVTPLQAAVEAQAQTAQQDPIDPNKNGWVKELDQNGLVFRYYEKGVARTGWLVTGTNPITQTAGLDRYWLDATGALALNRMIDPTTENDAGSWYAYSTITGNVVRGKYIADTGLVYLANDDGKLVESGWVVSDRYGDGLQRYYVESNARAAVPGYSSKGYDHYTLPQGYVLRGKYTDADGNVYLAKNSGRLESAGWVVSSRYGNGLQRYYVDEAAHACVPGYSTSGWSHYTTKEGHVLRGALDEGDVLRIADNEGKLEDGWIVMDAFGYGLQRYWQQDGQVVKNTLVQTGKNAWAFARPEGYVVRGKYVAADGTVYLANNGGKLTNPGWLVTSAYDGSLQRYYISDQTHAAVTGFFKSNGKSYFGMLGLGFVARPGISAIKADNDGVLHYAKGWVVTDAFGQGIQRYWMQDGGPAVDRLITNKEAGYWAYATPEGYVVRGKWLNPATGSVYLANNDGKLENPGWLVTAAYDGDLRRYRIDEQTHAATIGLFTVNGNMYLGRQRYGYVLTGYAHNGVQAFLADGDGILYPTIDAEVGTSKQGVTATQTSAVIDGLMYLFLPSFTSLESIGVQATLPTSTTTVGNVDMNVAAKGGKTFALTSSLDLTAGNIPRASNGAYLFDVKFGASQLVRRLAVMVSSNVSSLFVTSSDPLNQGFSYINDSPHHTTKADVSVLVVDAKGDVVYNKDAENGEYSTIKGRGNTSWMSTKKRGYQIKLSKKEDLLVTGDKDNKAKKWVLIANDGDPTLMRNSLAMQFGEGIGMGTEQFVPVDLYYDGAYRGSYLLIEKVEVGSGRVDVDDLEEAFEDANDGVDLSTLPIAQAKNSYGNVFMYAVGAKTPDDFSGGYILEVDPIFYAGEAMWFNTSRGYVTVKSPEFCSYQAMLYISEYVQKAFNELEGKGSAGLADRGSFIKLLLANEFCKNVDFYYSSTFFNKDSGEVLVSGPLWDFDSAFGTRVEGPSSKGFLTAGPQQFIASNKDLVAGMAELWKSAGRAVAMDLLGYIEGQRIVLRGSQAMNQVMWGFKSFGSRVAPLATYDANVDYLVTWIKERIAWMDGALK